MSALELTPWTVEKFFAWQEQQDGRYELVDGFPLKMMTGASQRHDAIVVNIIRELATRLRGKPCRTFTADGAVATSSSQIRRPDIGVDCGPRDPNSYKAAEPTVVFEVLSRSTRSFDQLRKIEEYKALSSLRHIVFIDTKETLATHWRREPEGEWERIEIRGILGALDLDAIGTVLLMDEIYEDVTFD